MSKRTKIVFNSTLDFWKVFEDWALENGYKYKKTESDVKTYQKGVGFLVAPMMVSVEEKEDKIFIECWVRPNIFIGLLAIFILPREIKIESGGFILCVPRKIARTAINKLLEKLNQPLIH